MTRKYGQRKQEKNPPKTQPSRNLTKRGPYGDLRNLLTT